MSISKKTFSVLEEETGQKSPVKAMVKAIGDALDWRSIADKIIDDYPVFYDKNNLWWIWNANRSAWEITDDVEIMNLVDDQVDRNTLKGGIKFEIIEAFKRRSRKRAPQEVPASWVQFKDQVYNLNTGETIKASNEYFLTNPIPHPLSDAIETPRIDELLQTWAGEDWMLLKQVVAFCCLRDYPLHRIFLLIGSGSNGKGTYLRLINTFLGKENIASTEMDLLIKNQFHITKLHKKLCCQMSETNFQSLSNTSMLKRLSGGDLVGFEYKNKKPFDDYNYAKIIIATNSLPVTHDKTDGFYRRWLIIDFPNRFNEKGDPLISIPKEEFGCLARWSCHELQRLLKEREFHNERTIEERKNRYEDRSNPLKSFISERYEEDLNGVVPASQFFNDFVSWSVQRGFRQLTYQVVRTMMKEEGFEYDKQRLPFFDNPVAVIIGLKSVPAVPVVPALTVQPIHIYTNPNPLELPEQLEQECSDNIDKCHEYINKHPDNNAFDIEELFSTEQVRKWVEMGELFESPYGTYKRL